MPAGKLKASVLKIAHHGPDIIVVSSGRRNFGRGTNPRYLPDESTLERYCCHRDGIRIYRTDQDDEAEGRTGSDDERADGDHVVVRTNGVSLEVQAYSGGEPITIEACYPS